MYPIPLICQSLRTCPSLLSCLPQGKLKKNKIWAKQTITIIKEKEKHCSSIFPISPFILVALAAAVHHTVNPFVQTASFANVRCNESLDWVEASGFWYTINTGSSPRILSNSLLLPCVLICCSCGSAGLHVLQQFMDGVDAGLGQLKAQNVGLGGS